MGLRSLLVSGGKCEISKELILAVLDLYLPSTPA